MEQKQGREFMLTGREGEEIALKTAAEWTKNYRDREPGDIISQFFGKEILNQILGQEGCVGIRIYYANDEDLNGFQKLLVMIGNFFSRTLGGAKGTKHLILTGADQTGTDQLPTDAFGEAKPTGLVQGEKFMAAAAGSSKNYILGEQAMPCPGSAGCPNNVLTGR